LFGDASYSIYLVHVPVISAGCKVLQMADGYWGVDPLAALAIVSIAGTAAGIVLHQFIELPLLKAGRRTLLGERSHGGLEPRPQRIRMEASEAVCAIKESA
jgi:peptidoglycan/LPS O-acetylase OafA/YrhL